jgi:hypothetical protein
VRLPLSVRQKGGTPAARESLIKELTFARALGAKHPPGTARHQLALAILMVAERRLSRSTDAAD